MSLPTSAVHEAAQVARFAVVLGFVVLGLRVTRTRGDDRRRAVIGQLLAYILLVHVLIVMARNEAWPFSAYPLMTESTDRERTINMTAFRAVDSQGVEWPVDPLAWSPLSQHAVTGWFDSSGTHVDEGDRYAALRFLLQRAETARRRRTMGARYIGNARLLGPMTAPDIYATPDVLPAPSRFRALRVYRFVWRPDALLRDPSHYSRTLLAEARE
jgi:hypothetical protein